MITEDPKTADNVISDLVVFNAFKFKQPTEGVQTLAVYEFPG